MKKKILVCGATGFIGRNILEALAKDSSYEVYGTYFKSLPFEISGTKMVKADLTDKDEVNRVVKGMDIVIQAAATTSGAKDIVSKPYYHVTDNAVMNSLIFRACYEHKILKVIFFSCTVMYQPSDVPLKETDFNANQDIYPNYFGVGWTKVYIEKMCDFYSRLSDTQYTIIRHSNIYGPWDKFDLDKSHVFGATITKVMTAEENGRIIVWGSGEEERDLLYVSDLVEFVSLILRKQKTSCELFNIGYGSAISIKELVRKIITLSGKKLSMEHDLSKPTIKTRLCLDSSKAKALTGWQPEISMDEGITKTIEWYKGNILNR